MSGEIENDPSGGPDLILTLRADAAAVRRGGFVGDAEAFAQRLERAAAALSRPAWTDEQVEAAARVFINERHRMGIIAPKWEAWTDEERRCQVKAMRAALASLAQTEGEAG